jgi:hypothetical protein
MTFSVTVDRALVDNVEHNSASTADIMPQHLKLPILLTAGNSSLSPLVEGLAFPLYFRSTARKCSWSAIVSRVRKSYLEKYESTIGLLADDCIMYRKIL